MIRYFEGTVFNLETQALVNTVNCVGFMGAGIALEFMLRYPSMFEDYAEKCKNGKITIGKVDYFNGADGRVIINFPTKQDFKYPSRINWIEQGLINFVQTYKEQGIKSVAFPKLGTNNGGLNWDDVKQVMEKYLSKIDIDVCICLDKTKEAEGLELVMLNKFNSMSLNQIESIVKLNTKQKINIQKEMPYKRFWKINETPSVGKKTYAALFKYFYDYSINGIENPIQMSLFE